jgi:hypothetical protein
LLSNSHKLPDGLGSIRLPSHRKPHPLNSPDVFGSVRPPSHCKLHP